MKSNNLLFLKIWCLHIFVYYTIIGSMFQAIDYSFLEWNYGLEFLYRCIFSFGIGLLGYFDFPCCVFISILFTSILLRFKIQWFSAYVISIVLLQVFLHLYFWIVMKEFRFYTFTGRAWNAVQYKINYLFFVIPSLLIAIGINWIVFRKSYKRLQIKNKKV
jgi:hypothetical protein